MNFLRGHGYALLQTDDQVSGTEVSEKDQIKNNPDKGQDPVTDPPDVKEVLERNRYLESELKKLVEARDKAKEDKRKAEAEKEKAQLMEEKKYKDLIEKLESENKGLLPMAESWKQYELKQRETFKSILGDLWKEKYETIDLDVLEDLAQAVKPRPAVDTDNGRATATLKTLTDRQRKEAKDMGLSEADYLDLIEHREKIKRK